MCHIEYVDNIKSNIVQVAMFLDHLLQPFRKQHEKLLTLSDKKIARDALASKKSERH